MNKYSEMTDEEKSSMWDIIAEELSKPKSARKKGQEMIEEYGIPTSTYYWKTTTEDFMRQVVRNCLLKGKRALPDILNVLENLAKSGKEKSIEMYLKYIAELTEKMDMTSGGDKIVFQQTFYAKNNSDSLPVSEDK